MATYGSFPGVKVQTVSGGITGIEIGEEENLVLFGESEYQTDDPLYDSKSDGDEDALTSGTETSEPNQINARREANDLYTDGSEIAEAMKEALANGANLDFMYGVAVPRMNAVDESFAVSAGDTGTLDHAPIYEDASTLVEDTGNITFEFRYDPAPSTDGGYSTAPDDTIFVNPLTGQYAATSGTFTGTDPSTISYKWLDWDNAFSSKPVSNVVNEDETGVYVALSDSDSVSIDLQSQVSTLRNEYQLINGLCIAEPNANEIFEDATKRGGADARYATSTYGDTADTFPDGTNPEGANQSVTEEYMYKFAPAREVNEKKTVMGGVGGLFAGNAINDPIYNEALNGYQSLEQQFAKSEADDMRDADIIPIRDSGTIRVKGNRSTAYSESGATGADFWVRRITDRVILIGKLVGDQIIGRINDEQTRDTAETQIRVQMEGLVQDRLIRSNADGNNWSVDVYEDSSNPNEVNIDISFTPYGIVKRVDETITIDTTN